MNRLLLLLFLWGSTGLISLAQTSTKTSASIAAGSGVSDSLDQKQSATVDAPTIDNQPPPPAGTDGFQLTNNVFIVVVIFMILLFSFSIIRSLLSPRSTDPLEATELIRVVSMILIVTCALLVPVVAGQISSIPTVAAPLYSLLGTIAGYLLGKSSLSGSGTTSGGSGVSSNQNP